MRNYGEEQILRSHVLKKSREFLFAHPEFPLTKLQQAKLQNLLSRRKRHEPIAYILGKKEFYGRDFFVNRNVLIPRPLTEELVEKVITESQNHRIKTIIDIGTGSGAIIITLAKELKGVQFVATDTSKKALQVAQKNAKKLGVLKKIKFFEGDLLSSLVVADNCPPLQNVCIIANLPYISVKKYKTLSEDIRLFEPKGALVAKDGGLFYYKKLFSQIQKLKKRDLMRSLELILFLEIDRGQKIPLKNSVRELFPKAEIQFFSKNQIVKIVIQ